MVTVWLLGRLTVHCNFPLSNQPAWHLLCSQVPFRQRFAYSFSGHLPGDLGISLPPACSVLFVEISYFPSFPSLPYSICIAFPPALPSVLRAGAILLTNATSLAVGK